LDNRRLLVAALLSMAVLFLWQVLFPPPEPPHRPAAEPSAATVGEPAPSAEARTGESETAASGATAEATPSVAEVLVAAEAEEYVVLENELLRAEFSNRGAQLVSLLLKGRNERDGEPLELVQRRGETPYPFALVDAAGTPLPVTAALFAVEREAGAEPGVRFVYRGAEGAATKRFRLRTSGLLDFELTAPGASPGWGALLGPGVRNATKEELGSRFNVRAAVWQSQGEVENLSAGDAKAPTTLPGGALDWVGLEDTYFLTAAVPESGLGAARLEPVRLAGANGNSGRIDALLIVPGAEPSAEEKKLPVDLRLVLVAGGERLAGTTYWGAKLYDRLAAFPWGLEKTVRFGFFGFLAKPLLRALQWIHAHLTPNYGWAIVLLTVALKMVLLPLSLAGFKSMRKMQKLAPKMQAIRERFRPKLRDKQGRFNADMQRQMNEEIMGLYRAEGVNPAGGCLPILVQLPIFFAFYQLLSTAVELWRSPWALWIHDLTAPDPYWVLPIVMGASQLVQTKMTPPPPDPIQRRLIQAMPIVFTVFSLGFPSGLVLYWLTNNVLSIAQQGFYNRIRERAEAQEQEAAVAEKAAGRRRGKKKS
jgi:YidC/Oxa1 family membrane protein insertase